LGKVNNVTLKYSTGLRGQVSAAATEIICHIPCLQRPHFLAVEIFFSPQEELFGKWLLQVLILFAVLRTPRLTGGVRQLYVFSIMPQNKRNKTYTKF
jgi:hypothetical protein